MADRVSLLTHHKQNISQTSSASPVNNRNIKPFKGTREENLSTELMEKQALSLHCFPPSTLYTHRSAC